VTGRGAGAPRFVRRTAPDKEHRQRDRTHDVPAPRPVNLRIGVVFPQTEIAGDPDATRRVGMTAEQLGYDHLLAYDHVLGAEHRNRTEPLWGPYTERDPFHDPFVLFAYLAGCTSRLGFATGVLVLPQRQTALVAKQAADLAILSGGRFRLGVGVGWNPVEYTALGQDFGSRGARIDEQIGLLRRLWREPVVEFEGRFDRIDRAACVPRPAHDVPIWLGGFSNAALRRAARVADGFIFAGPQASILERWSALRGMLVEVGRPLDRFGAQAVTYAAHDPGEIVSFAREWMAAGGTHLGIESTGLGLRSAAEHVERLGTVAGALAAAGLLARDAGADPAHPVRPRRIAPPVSDPG
jgi:probable F420-dependent oxidoreductase